MPTDFYKKQRQYFNNVVNKFQRLKDSLSSAKNMIDGLVQHDVDNDENLTEEEKVEYKKIRDFMLDWYDALVGVKGEEFTVKGLGL